MAGIGTEYTRSYDRLKWGTNKIEMPSRKYTSIVYIKIKKNLKIV